MPVLTTEEEVTFRVGRNVCDDAPESARVSCGTVNFIIMDPFVAYLAARKNKELGIYLKSKAEEIRMFLEHMEARVIRK